MRQVQAAEAAASLLELLADVKNGESIVITQDGENVARLVPVPEQERWERHRAVERFRERRVGWERVEVTTEEILAWRHAGHRV